MRDTTRRVRWIAALFSVLAASGSPASPGGGAQSAEPVMFGRLSACVADPEATAAVLEDLLGWRTAPPRPAVRTGRKASGPAAVVLSDARGFQLELAHAANCGPTPYKRITFVARDRDRVLQRIPSFSASPAGAPPTRAGTGAPVPIPVEVTPGTPVSLEETPPRAAPRAHGKGAIRVDRIAIFVADLERSVRFYTDVLGLHRNPEVIELDGAANARSGGLKVSFVDANGVWLALVQPVGDGPLMDYLHEHGDGHIAELIVEVDDLAAFYDRMQARGISLVDTRGEPVDPQVKAHVLEPYGDRIAYLPGGIVGGLVIELAQRGPPETSLLERRDRAGATRRSSRPVPANPAPHGP